MKLLLFAHTPPPHHGQSYMIQLMLDGLGGDARNRTQQSDETEQPVQCYHVNCRVSEGIDDIGGIRLGKLFSLLRYCRQALWIRFRYGVENFYYVPAPGKRSALYRDWLVMLLCRPVFKRVIFHWHAVGLANWLETQSKPLERFVTRALLSNVALSIALTRFSNEDALYFNSQRIEIVPNGIPDPCPEYGADLRAVRNAKTKTRITQIQSAHSQTTDRTLYKALFLAHCTRDKGLFDALDGVALLNQRAGPVRVHLTVAGSFMNLEEEHAFHERIAQPDLADAVTYAGFVSGSQKADLLRESDCLCFPTYYAAESFGLVIVEAMAFGVPSITTRWRGIPEILPPDYPGFVELKAPEQVADAFMRMAALDLAEEMRELYLRRFTVETWMAGLRQALLGAENGIPRS